MDHETGLALLGSRRPATAPAVIGRASGVHAGLPVFMLTCTGERERKGATGHVSAVGPFEAFWEYMLDRAIMTTAINPGLAGAPLFDPDGRVIGIVSLGLAAVGRYSLAIPIDLYLRERRWLEGEEASRIPGVDRLLSAGLRRRRGALRRDPRRARRQGRPRARRPRAVGGGPARVVAARAVPGGLRKQPGESLGFQILRESSIRVVDVVAGDRYEFFR